MRQSAMKHVRAFASMEFALAALAALAATLVYALYQPAAAAGIRQVILGLMAASVATALAVNPVLRRRRALALFHACLLVLLAAAIYGDLVHFRGRVELVAGQAFDPALVSEASRGPLHRRGFAGVDFVQDDFSIRYRGALVRGRTAGEVVLPGGRRLGFDTNSPLEIAGYRFTPTSNKGFAALLTWNPERGGEPVTGAVHFPSYPVYDWKQVNTWRSPTGVEHELELLLDQRPDRAADWVLNRSLAEGRLRVDTGAGTRELGPGARLPLAGGSARFEGVRLWMGYEIDYDPAPPVMFVVAVLAVASLSWHLAAGGAKRGGRGVG